MRPRDRVRVVPRAWLHPCRRDPAQHQLRDGVAVARVPRLRWAGYAMSCYPQRCCAAWRVPPVRLAMSAQLYPSPRTAATASVICPSSSERSAIRCGSDSMSVPALRPAALTMRRTKAMYSAVSIGLFTCQGCIDVVDKSMHSSAYSSMHDHPRSCMIGGGNRLPVFATGTVDTEGLPACTPPKGARGLVPGSGTEYDAYSCIADEYRLDGQCILCMVERRTLWAS